jgi:hypothetical protein
MNSCAEPSACMQDGVRVLQPKQQGIVWMRGVIHDMTAAVTMEDVHHTANRHRSGNAKYCKSLHRRPKWTSATCPRKGGLHVTLRGGTGGSRQYLHAPASFPYMRARGPTACPWQAVGMETSQLSRTQTSSSESKSSTCRWYRGDVGMSSIHCNTTGTICHEAAHAHVDTWQVHQ